MVRLSVNIDHTATVRELRQTPYPDIIEVANCVKRGGAYGITVHLRIDRRHIKETDIERLLKEVDLPLNVELSMAPDILEFILQKRPHSVCLVPERPGEVTTEGGLNVFKTEAQLKEVIPEFKAKGMRVTLFVEPDPTVLEKAKALGADAVELNTAHYSENKPGAFDKLKAAASFGKSIGLEIHAGHGLHYGNVSKLREITEIEELSIGHSIVARAIILGMEQATREMVELLR